LAFGVVVVILTFGVVLVALAFGVVVVILTFGVVLVALAFGVVVVALAFWRFVDYLYTVFEIIKITVKPILSTTTMLWGKIEAQ